MEFHQPLDSIMFPQALQAASFAFLPVLARHRLSQNESRASWITLAEVGPRTLCIVALARPGTLIL